LAQKGVTVLPAFEPKMLHTSYDVHVHLPTDVERMEHHIGSSIYLAFISAVTGWIMSPAVRSCPSNGQTYEQRL
jgi:hypothetical protein